MKGDAVFLIFEKQRLDRFDDDSRGKKVFSRPQFRVEHGAVDMAKVQPCAVAPDLSVEWRLAVGETDLEAELLYVEVAGFFDVGDEKLRLGREPKRVW